MVDVRTADFLGGSGKPIAMPKIYAPGEEPNPKNPGGISNNELARRKEAARLKGVKEHYDKVRAQNSKELGKKIVAEREAWRKTQPGFWERAGSDLKVLGPAVLKVAGTTAAVVATGGAAAGAIGLTSLAGITAAAVTADRVINAVNTGTKVVASVKKGDAAGLAGAAASGLSQAGVKVPALPDAVKKGKEAVASLNLPKVKIDVPDPKKQLAAAKQAASSAKAAVSSVTKAPAKTAAAVVKTVTAAAPKVAPPKVAPPKVTSAATNVFSIPKQAISAAEAARLKGEANIAHLKQTATAAVKPIAALTSAAALFKPVSTALANVKPAAVVKPTGANATIAIKPPATASKPPAMTTTRPPPASPSVASTITTAAPASAPPVIKPPPLADAPSSSGPTLEGYLVKLDGTIETRRRYRAA